MTERDKRDATERDDNGRTDAAGYDITPPPARPNQRSGNPGLHDEPPPRQEGWREFDPQRDYGGTWDAGGPYPETPDAEEGTLDPESVDLPGEGDMVERIITLLNEDPVEIYDLSVERQGETIILRGSAASAEDRARAADLAAAIPGVGHVENLLAAAGGPATRADTAT